MVILIINTQYLIIMMEMYQIITLGLRKMFQWRKGKDPHENILKIVWTLGVS